MKSIVATFSVNEKSISKNKEQSRATTASENVRRSVFTDYLPKEPPKSNTGRNLPPCMMSYFGCLKFDWPEMVPSSALPHPSMPHKKPQSIIKNTTPSSHNICMSKRTQFRLEAQKPRTVCLVKYVKQTHRKNDAVTTGFKKKFMSDEPLLESNGSKTWKIVKFDYGVFEQYKNVLQRSVKNLIRIKRM